MIVRQLFDQASGTYSYLLADRGEAVLVDPVFEQHARDAALIRELGLKLLATVDGHADPQVSDLQVACGSGTPAQVLDPPLDPRDA